MKKKQTLIKDQIIYKLKDYTSLDTSKPQKPIWLL